jgi:hypothetical protein
MNSVIEVRLVVVVAIAGMLSRAAGVVGLTRDLPAWCSDLCSNAGEVRSKSGADPQP